MVIITNEKLKKQREIQEAVILTFTAIEETLKICSYDLSFIEYIAIRN